MAVRPSGKPSAASQAVPMPIVVTVVVILVLLVGGMAVHYFGSRGSSPVRPGPVSSDQQWMNQKAQESGGDFSRLSPADQQRLLQMRGGGAPLALQMAYQALKK